MSTQPALDALRRLAPSKRPRVAVVLGSGWGRLTEHLQNAVQIQYSDLPGFPQATVAGHRGVLWMGLLGEHEVAVMSGRKHGYETGEVDGMKTPLKVLQALGCEVLVQTNAAGSLRHDLPPQSLMVISEHINLPQRSPLVGENGTDRFVGMVDAYDPSLRQLAHRVAKGQGVALQEGVYVWAFGPQFETPAEIRYFRQIGGDAVGMSTVPETILARHGGMRVLALSLITNMGAGMSQEQLSHVHTLAQASSASATASAYLAALIAHIDLTSAKA
jgi:purine-nucleoside phosphorylase